jgi:RNA polymerase sigma-70 factor, ECF subfamily
VPEPVLDADMEDRRTLRRFVDGDRDAFGELVGLHYDRLWAVALRVSGDPEDAADALQEAMIAAMRGAAGFRGDAKVSTWLHRIVVNACLDRHRKRKRLAEAAYPEQDPGIPDARDRIAERVTALEVERALGLLPGEQRSAIVLVDVEGYSITEAAQMLGIPAGTVKSRCSRGRAKLANELLPERNREGSVRVEHLGGDGKGVRG